VRDGPPALRALRDDPPDAVVIDLGRLPSHGREFGVSLRVTKATRGIPLVFVGGQPEKLARVREVLPDAVFTEWAEIGPALEEAIAAPPADPVAPKSVFAAYERVPLARKLGIGPGTVVGLADAPGGVRDPRAASGHDAPRGHRRRAVRPRPLVHDRARRRRARDRPHERTRARRRPVGAVAEAGVRAEERPHAAGRSPGRHGPRPGRLQGRRGRRDLDRATVPTAAVTRRL
jgi:hypothetical protein